MGIVVLAGMPLLAPGMDRQVTARKSSASMCVLPVGILPFYSSSTPQTHPTQTRTICANARRCQLVLGQHSGKLPTDCLQPHQRKRVHYYFHSNEPLSLLVPER